VLRRGEAVPDRGPVRVRLAGLRRRAGERAGDAAGRAAQQLSVGEVVVRDLRVDELSLDLEVAPRAVLAVHGDPVARPRERAEADLAAVGRVVVGRHLRQRTDARPRVDAEQAVPRRAGEDADACTAVARGGPAEPDGVAAGEAGVVGLAELLRRADRGAVAGERRRIVEVVVGRRLGRAGEVADALAVAGDAVDRV